MEKLKHWERIGYGLLFGAVVAAVVGIGTKFDLSKSDWAAWVQAVGTILAVVASFGFFYAQRRAELLRADADSVFTMTKAVIAVLSLCRWSISAMEIALEQMECQHPQGVIPFDPDYFNDLRTMFSQFVDPSGNFMSVQTASAFCDILMEARHDFYTVRDETLQSWVIERSNGRLGRARQLADLLAAHQAELLEACNKYQVNPIAGPLKGIPGSAK